MIKYNLKRMYKEKDWLDTLYQWADTNNIPKDKLPRNSHDLLRLTHLDLGNLGLSKLPKQIFYLQNLKVLDLSHNKLTRLPHSIDNLINLTTLHLSYNKLTSLPLVLAKLTNITLLSLDNNRIKKQSVENEVFNFLCGDIAHRSAGVNIADETSLLNRTNEEEPIEKPRLRTKPERKAEEVIMPSIEVPSFPSPSVLS